MKALVKTKFGPGSMLYMDVPEPVPGKSDIKIKIFACGICGTDIHLLHDSYPSCPPVITGHEFSGVVTEIGENVSTFRPGDRVVTLTATETCEECEWCRQGLRMLCEKRKSIGSGRDGGFAEYVIIPEKHAFRLAPEISMLEAALCEPLACVCRAVCEHANIKPGDTVLVAGAGIMGQLAAQVAIANGGIVIMTGLASDADRFLLAKKFGVYETIQVDQGAPLERIKELTDGQGPRIAIECSGAVSSTLFCLEALMKTGTYVQFAIPGEPIPLDMNLVLYKDIRIFSSFASERSSWLIALRLLSNHMVNLRPLVTSILPLSEWNEGFARTIAKKEFKVLLMPHPEDMEMPN